MDHGLKRFTTCQLDFISWIDYILNRSTTSDLNAWRMGNSIYPCCGFIIWYCSYAALPATIWMGEQITGYPKSTSKWIPIYFNRCKGWYKEINFCSHWDDENSVHSQLVANPWFFEHVANRNGQSISEIAGIVVGVEYLLACEQLESLFSSRHISLPELFEWNWIGLN